MVGAAGGVRVVGDLVGFCQREIDPFLLDPFLLTFCRSKRENPDSMSRCAAVVLSVSVGLLGNASLANATNASHHGFSPSDEYFRYVHLRVSGTDCCMFLVRITASLQGTRGRHTCWLEYARNARLSA